MLYLSNNLKKKKKKKRNINIDLAILPSHDRKAHLQHVRLANSKAGIKPTAPLSAFNKENLIEFPLDSVHYLYKQSNPNSVLLSCTSLWVNLLSRIHYYKLKEKEKQYSKLKEKKKKRNIK